MSSIQNKLVYRRHLQLVCLKENAFPTDLKQSLQLYITENNISECHEEKSVQQRLNCCSYPREKKVN